MSKESRLLGMTRAQGLEPEMQPLVVDDEEFEVEGFNFGLAFADVKPQFVEEFKNAHIVTIVRADRSTVIERRFWDAFTVLVNRGMIAKATLPCRKSGALSEFTLEGSVEKKLNLCTQHLRMPIIEAIVGMAYDFYTETQEVEGDLGNLPGGPESPEAPNPSLA